MKKPRPWQKDSKSFKQKIEGRIAMIKPGQTFTQRNLWMTEDYELYSKRTLETGTSAVVVRMLKAGMLELLQGSAAGRPAIYKRVVPEPEVVEPVGDVMVDMAELAEQMIRQFAAQNHSLRTRVEELEVRLRDSNSDFKQLQKDYLSLQENYRRGQDKINELNQVIANKKASSYVPLSKIQDIYKDAEK